MYPIRVSDERAPTRRTREGRVQGGKPRARVDAHDLGRVHRRRSTGRSFPAWGAYVVFAAFLALSAVFGTYASITLHRRSNVNAAAPYHPAGHVVIFVMSGFTGADMTGADLPHIKALASTGVAYPDAWTGEFPTTPASLAASLSTGAFARRHGLVGTRWVDQQTHLVVAPTTQAQALTGSIDQILEPSRVASLVSLLKVQSPMSKVLAVGGSNCSTTSAAATWAADYVVCASRNHDRWRAVAVAGHQLPSGTFSSAAGVAAVHGHGLAARIEGWSLGRQDHWVARTALTAMSRVHPAVTFVTFPEPDVLGQYVAPTERGSVMHALLRGIDRDIGRIVAETHRLKTYGDTAFALVSMRGFEPISAKIPLTNFSQAVVGTGTSSRYLWADGAVMLGLSDPSLGQAAAQVIGAERLHRLDAVYYKSRGSYHPQYINPDLPVHVAAAQTYLLGTSASPASAEVIAALAPHTGTQGGRLARLPRTATGVGLQWSNQEAYILLAGHGTFRAVRSNFPARLVDVAPTLEALMGIKPAPGDGTVLADATFRPPAGTVRKQGLLRSRWNRYLTALKRWESGAGT